MRQCIVTNALTYNTGAVTTISGNNLSYSNGTITNNQSVGNDLTVKLRPRYS